MTQFGLEPRPMGTLTERLTAFLEEASGEVAELERRRETLEEERAEAIVRIRSEYAEKIKAVDTELERVRRLQRAMEWEPPAPKPAKPKPKPGERQTRTPERPGSPRPSDRVMLATLRAVAGGADVAMGMAEAAELSRASIDNALLYLRGDGLVRLTGERRTSEGAYTKARTFAITPEGEAFLSANLSTNGTHS